MRDYEALTLRAERKTNHFLAKKDERMFRFWSGIYYFARRKAHEQELIRRTVSQK